MKRALPNRYHAGGAGVREKAFKGILTDINIS
jgi:hypothetical protein